MPGRAAPEVLPPTAVLPISELDRLANTAAANALRRFKEEESIQEEMKQVAEEVLDRFLEKAFDIPPGDVKALIELRKDFTAMRAAREMRDSMLKHGIMVMVGALMIGVLSAIWFKVTGGAR